MPKRIRHLCSAGLFAVSLFASTFLLGAQAADASDILYGVYNKGDGTSLLATLDAGSGLVETLNYVSSVPGNQTNISFGGLTAALDPVTHDAVPEPATWSFALLGFGSIGSVMRRRSQCFALV